MLQPELDAVPQDGVKLSVYNFKINNCETEESKKSDDNI